MKGRTIKITLTEEEVKIVKTTTRKFEVEVPADFTQVYADGLRPFLKIINSCELALFVYMLEESVTEYEFSINEKFKDGFSNFMAELGKDYSESAIKNAFVNLIKTDRVQRVSRGVYMLNPAFFWRGPKQDRIEAYKHYIGLKENNE